MLSKSTAAILLFLALAVAGFGGGYLALKTFGSAGPMTDDEVRKLQVEVDSLQDGAGKDASGAAAPGATGAAAGGGARRGGGGSGTARGAAGGGAAAAGGGGVAPIPGPIPPQAPAPPAAPAQPAGAAAGTPGAQAGGAPPVEVGRTYEEVMVRAGEILDLQLQAPISSETAKVEDMVDARIIKDVKGGNMLAIPAGTKLMGFVTMVSKGNAISEAARIEVKFDTIVMRNGDEFAVKIDPIMHVGPTPSGDSKAKIAGGAAAGAALGWLKGGVSGAAAGAAIGGGAGTAVKIVEGRKPAELPAGAQARVELRAPVFISVLK